MKYIKNILLIILLLGFTKINEVKGATMETSFTCKYTSNYGNQYVEYGIDYSYQRDKADYWYLFNEYDHSVNVKQKYADINTPYGFALFYKGNPPENALLNQTINVSFTYANNYLQDAFDRYESYFAKYEDYEPFEAKDFCPKSSIEGKNGTYKVIYDANEFTPKKKSGSSTSQPSQYEINVNSKVDDKFSISLIFTKNGTQYNVKARLRIGSGKDELNWTSASRVVTSNQSNLIELPITVEYPYGSSYTIRIKANVIQDILKSIENGTYANKYYTSCNHDISVYYIVTSLSDTMCDSSTIETERPGSIKPDDYTGSNEIEDKDPIKSPTSGNSGNNNSESEKCKALLGDPTDSKYPAYWFQMILDIMKYVAIVALLILSTMDFLKASVQDDKDSLKKTTIKTVKRFVYAVLIFFLPIIINVLMKLLGAYGTCGLG